VTGSQVAARHLFDAPALRRFRRPESAKGPKDGKPV
jgi:hypothetical protein